MVPKSASDEPVASKLAVRCCTSVVNAAVGGTFTGGPVSGPAEKLSNDRSGAVPVQEPDGKKSTPRSPGAASAAVEALVVSSQETGSWVPYRHTLPRSVVGFVPSAWN